MRHLLKKGFTLIELLVVIAIIGILVALIFPNLNGARERARDARRKTDLNSIQQALRLYYNDNQEFPTTLDWNAPLLTGDTVYMQQLPQDPSSTSTSTLNYIYSSSDGTSYTLTANLENKSDPDLADSHARCTGTYEPEVYVVCEQ